MAEERKLFKIINMREYRATNEKVRPEKVNLSNSTEENECSPLLCVHVKEKVKDGGGWQRKPVRDKLS